MSFPTRFIVNETNHLMPHFHLGDMEAAWVRSGRKLEDFRYRAPEIEVVRQRNLLERLKAKRANSGLEMPIVHQAETTPYLK